MPGTVSDGPSVALSFANNFWGKDDAGVEPLLQRMLNAKQTSDELKSFYTGIDYQPSLLPGLEHIADAFLKLDPPSKKNMLENYSHYHVSPWVLKRPGH